MPTGNNSEIVIYRTDAEMKLEVRLNGETVWLNRQQMAVLFDRDVKTIGKHVNNALADIQLAKSDGFLRPHCIAAGGGNLL